MGSETGAFIPPEQRFYAGGPNDVRGFERNELGPVVYVIPQSAVTNPDSDQRRFSPGRGYWWQRLSGWPTSSSGCLRLS